MRNARAAYPNHSISINWASILGCSYSLDWLDSKAARRGWVHVGMDRERGRPWYCDPFPPFPLPFPLPPSKPFPLPPPSKPLPPPLPLPYPFISVCNNSVSRCVCLTNPTTAPGRPGHDDTSSIGSGFARGNISPSRMYSKHIQGASLFLLVHGLRGAHPFLGV